MGIWGLIVYDAVIVAALVWVIASRASWVSLGGFAAANLVGLLFFDNRVVRRRFSMGRPWQQAGHLLAGVVMLAIPLALFWNAAPFKAASCVGVFLVTRALFRSEVRKR